MFYLNNVDFKWLNFSNLVAISAILFASPTLASQEFYLTPYQDHFSVNLTSQETDSGFNSNHLGIAAGIRFNDIISGQLESHKMEDNTSICGLGAKSRTDVEYRIFSVLGEYPIWKSLRGYGKVGYALWKADIETGQPFLLSPRIAKGVSHDTGENAFVGVGLKWEILSLMSLILEYNRIDIDPFSEGLKYDVTSDLSSVGVHFSI